MGLFDAFKNKNNDVEKIDEQKLLEKIELKDKIIKKLENDLDNKNNEIKKLKEELDEVKRNLDIDNQ